MLYYKYALQVRAQKCLVFINEVILIISKFQNFLVCYWILCIHNELIFDFHIDIKSEIFNNLFYLEIDFDAVLKENISRNYEFAKQRSHIARYDID